MEFGWINLFGFCVIAIMMVPNLIYAVKHSGKENKCANKAILLIEQTGRYASMALMFFPVGVWKFVFSSVAMLLVYIFANGILLLSYIVVWVFYFKRHTLGKALALAIIPAGIFLISGMCLYHWLLVSAAILFAIGHIPVTYQNNI